MVPEKAFDGIVSGSKGLSLRKRAANVDNFDSLQDIIGRTESLVKNRAIMQGSSQKLCGSCHESCMRCNGPHDTDCVVCDSDYNEIIIGSNISCSRKSNNITDNTLLTSIKHELRGYSLLQIVLISAMIGFSLLITCIFINLLCRKYDSDNVSTPNRDKNFSGKYSYDPIIQENEEILLARLPNIPRIEYNDNDSDDASDI